MDSRLRLPAAGVHRLAENVWRLGTHHLAYFLIRGRERSLLFETGVSVCAPLVLEQMAGLGAAPEEVDLAVVSHAHSDHAAGQEALLRRLPRARLVMTETSRRHLAKARTLELFADEDAFTGRELALREPGLNGSEPARTGRLLPEPLEIHEAGESLDLGGTRVELLAAEGHVPGGLLAWLPEQGVMLSSDSTGFVGRGRPRFPLYFVSFDAYWRTMEKIQKLRPRVLAPAHQEFFTGPAAERYLDDLARDLRRVRRDIRRQAHGPDDEALARRLFETYYKDELTIYPAESIMECCQLLVRRSLED